MMKKTTLAFALVFCAFGSYPVFADDIKPSSVYDDLYKPDKDSGDGYCGSSSDCKKQDKVREEDNRAPDQIGNSFQNSGPKSGSVGSIMSDQMRPR